MTGRRVVAARLTRSFLSIERPSSPGKHYVKKHYLGQIFSEKEPKLSAVGKAFSVKSRCLKGVYHQIANPWNRLRHNIPYKILPFVFYIFIINQKGKIK